MLAGFSETRKHNHSSSSFELFALSIMQEDIHTLCVRSCACALMLCLQVFCHTGPPQWVYCLDPPPVCHIKMEASRYVLAGL